MDQKQRNQVEILTLMLVAVVTLHKVLRGIWNLSGYELRLQQQKVPKGTAANLSSVIVFSVLLAIVVRRVFSWVVHRFGYVLDVRFRPKELNPPATVSYGLVQRCTQPEPRPDILYLTHRDRASVPPYVFERFRHFTKGFEIKFFDDGQCRKSLVPFGHAVLRKFDELSGAHRADLWRYCMLFQHGGVYTDIKTVFTRQLSEIVPDRTQNYTVIGLPGLLSNDPDRSVHIHQAFLAVTKHSPVMHDCIVNVMATPLPLRDYLAFTRQLHEILLAYLGVVTVGTTDSWTLYKETHHMGYGHLRDHHGWNRLTFENEQGEVMAVCRDPNYPWKDHHVRDRKYGGLLRRRGWPDPFSLNLK